MNNHKHPEYDQTGLIIVLIVTEILIVVLAVIVVNQKDSIQKLEQRVEQLEK